MATDTLPFSAYAGDGPYLFASYSHADSAAVYDELVRLRDAGFNIWYDEGIAPSDRWTQQIAGAIDAASVFVAFITPQFVGSEYCVDELEFAVTHRKPVLAIHLLPTELSPGLELTLGSRQALLKYRYPHDTYAHKVHQALEGLLGGCPGAADLPSQPRGRGADRPRRSFVGRLAGLKAYWRSVIALAAAMAILAVSGTWYLADDAGAIDSIAILPFINGSADPDTDYIAEGIGESITNSLSGIQSLRVMAQNSVRHYRGSEVDARLVGKELGVRSVLMGTITSFGETLRIQAELIDTHTGAQLWGQQETRERRELLNIQDEIAARISSSLKVKLSSSEKNRLAERHVPNAGAYERYLRGRYYWNQRTNAGYRKAIELFRQAIDLDPGYARAYVGLADSQAFIEIEGVPPQQQYETALGIIQKALAIDDTLGEAHATMAMLLMNKDWDFAGAVRENRRAIQLAPSYATAYHWYGELLVQMGRFDEGIELYRQAAALDPLSSAISSDIGIAWYFARDYDRAIAELEKSIDADPAFSRTHLYLAKVYAQVGRYTEAMHAQQEGRLLAGDNSDELARRVERLQLALKRSGPQGYWETQLQFAEASRGADWPVDAAELYARVGDADRSFELLEIAYAKRQFPLLFLNVDPAWDSVRDDPRFRDLMQRIGMPAASADADMRAAARFTISE